MLLAMVSCGRSHSAAAQAVAADAESRAVAFLAVEVPKWRRAEACYSCHNNGDAARALIVATKRGALADRAPLADTLLFLASPERWDDNGPDGPFKDKQLQRIQFAAALTTAHATGVQADRIALGKAAALVAELQQADGHWETDSLATLGSPATYGRYLATAMACRTLATADRDKYRAALERAWRWFQTAPARNVLDAAATILALAEPTDPASSAERERALRLVLGGQASDGGWGPYVNAPAEAFDTALVLLALAALPNNSELAAPIARGRAYLIASQQPDGSWPATTRPSGNDSYAQQLSTTGWATEALLTTQKR